ncbi:hypothetical protein [Luteipulveratus halotolerans]|nr:hypothetical protein [Luteipulveratus halotolerans]
MSAVRRTTLRSPDDHARAQVELDALRDAPAHVQVVVRRPDHVLWCRAAVAGPGFVASCVLVDEADGSTVTVVASGALEHLVDTLWELIPETSVSGRPAGWGREPVAVEDVALLADGVRHGDVAALDVALDITGHGAMPEWVREAAYGMHTVLMIGLSSTGSDVVIRHAQLMPSGWFEMSLGDDGLARVEPLGSTDLRHALLNACTSMVVSGAIRTAA